MSSVPTPTCASPDTSSSFSFGPYDTVNDEVAWLPRCGGEGVTLLIGEDEGAPVPAFLTP
jgi:hypothetical protein